METKKLVIFGFGQRGMGYAAFAKKYPDKFEVVAVIEVLNERLEKARREYPNARIYTNYKDFLKDKVYADVVAVCTQDEQHKEHAVAMMKAGYDLLLEKPIANTQEDCEDIYEASIRYKRKVIVCHVLRYTPFYSSVKKIIDSGELGEVITINASENVGYYHQAHSFVRGPWRNKEESSPMILAKCCHDMDIIRYLMGETCLSISSFGNLYYFNRSHAPEGCADFCSECKYKDCIYNAQKLYTTPGIKPFAGYFTLRWDDKDVLEDLKGTQYDRCVYKCDNDVVDHQVTIMNFDGGKTASHTMTAFSNRIYRDLKVHGTKAELYGVIEDNKFEIRRFGGKVETVDIDLSSVNVGGHMGGDYYLMNSLYKELNGEKGDGVTFLNVSLESHLMAFAAEKSRLSGGMPVKITTEKKI